MEEVILRPAGYTIRSKTELANLRRRGCEDWHLEGGGKGAGSTRHKSRWQWLSRFCIRLLATCPACGANGQGRLTATPAVTVKLLAVAHQPVFAVVVPHKRFPVVHRIPGANARARVHPPRRAALAMGHLVRVHGARFSKPDPQNHSQPRHHHLAVAPMRRDKRATRRDSASDALRALQREVGAEGVIHRPAGCTIPPKRELVHLSRRGCEG